MSPILLKGPGDARWGLTEALSIAIVALVSEIELGPCAGINFFSCATNLSKSAYVY